MSEVKVPFVDLKAQYLSLKEEIDEALLGTLEKAQFVGGESVTSFEKQFADYLGVAHCISCGNGTDALEMTLKVLDIGPGDEVIVPANSWISTAEAVTHVGAKPIFADVQPRTYNIDPEQVEALITERTKCVIPVHFTGLPANMDEISRIAAKHKLNVVEDCAQAHGAEVGNKKVGTLGIAGTFSFYPSKNLGAYGDGGCIVTDDDTLAEKLRRTSNHGQLSKHDHLLPGRNSRLDSIQAALLEVKLSRLDLWNLKRNQVAKWYQQFLDPGVKKQVISADFKHVFHLFIIQVQERDELRALLLEKGILTGIHYPNPIPLTQAYAYLGHEDTDFPVASKLSKEIISLPMYPELSKGQVRYVSGIINEFIRSHG